MEKAEASFKDSNVTITMKAGKTLTKEDLEKAFKDSQFSVTSFETVAEEEEKKEGDEGKKEDPKKDDGSKKEDPKKEEPPKKSD
ncbi:MAG: hypothetical protein IT464_07565 [Planctomycetes bacterium]|nr:hypothetical protein [Planctomycetota bacterium]